MNYDGKIDRFFNDVVARYETRLINDALGINAMLGASQENTVHTILKLLNMI